MIQKKSFTSFGKLILSDEKTNPVFSFGTDKKFEAGGKVLKTKTPGPIYNVTDQFKYKKVFIE